MSGRWCAGSVRLSAARQRSETLAESRTPPHTTVHYCTPTCGLESHTVWRTFTILRIKSRQTPLFEPGSATFCRTGYRFCARPILMITTRSLRRPGGPTHPPSRGTEGVCPLGGSRAAAGGRTAIAAVRFERSENKKIPGARQSPGDRRTAATYSPNWWVSTIGDGELNFSVRNGKRWILTAITTVVYYLREKTEEIVSPLQINFRVRFSLAIFPLGKSLGQLVQVS